MGNDWHMAGPGKIATPGTGWDICIMPDGTTRNLEREAEFKDFGITYAMTGTFNDWKFDAMEEDDMINGLYSIVVLMGKSQEHFQIVADDEESMTFYPAVPNCYWKSTEVLGPGKADRNQAWCINGRPGEVYRIEFSKSASDKVSVMWYNET